MAAPEGQDTNVRIVHTVREFAETQRKQWFSVRGLRTVDYPCGRLRPYQPQQPSAGPSVLTC